MGNLHSHGTCVRHDDLEMCCLPGVGGRRSRDGHGEVGLIDGRGKVHVGSRKRESGEEREHDAQGTAAEAQTSRAKHHTAVAGYSLPMTHFS